MKTLKMFAMFCTIVACTFLFANTNYAQDMKLTDPEIASAALTANQIDVDYAEIALKKSSNDAIKNFANTMKTDHLGVIDMATKLATKLKVTPKTNDLTKSLLDGAKKMKKTLNSKSGVAFDKAYIDNEVAYHEAVIGAVETVLIPQTQNKELKDLFIKIMPALKTHLEHAKMVQKDFK